MSVNFEKDRILDRLQEVQDTIAEWRSEDVFYGDRGYQRLLEEESDLEEELRELQGDDV